MSKIYITGHRNPDLDSVCAALAYANLKNAVDPKNEYIAVRCGHLNEAIKGALSSFGIIPPAYMRDCFPKVSDVMMKSEHRLDVNDRLDALAMNYKATNPSAVPVFNGQKFYGLLSIDDMAAWLLKEIGKKGALDTVPFIHDVIGEQAATVQANELFEDVKQKLTTSGFRGIAVFDGNKYVGYVTRRCFLKMPKYNFILVDHNEPRQSIRGIEDANIIEIIDHHRIDSVKTDLPVFIDAEPLGSTCTIIYQLFNRHLIPITKEIATVLLLGILSDTLILKSPTTATFDIVAANKLAEICHTDIQSFGMKIFSNVKGLEDRDPIEAITSDFKVYENKSVKVGIGQCEVTSLHSLSSYQQKYLDALDSVREKQNLSWAVLMITDIIREKSVLLSTDCSFAGHLPYATNDNRTFDMPGVMSRKKQLLPEILNTIEM